MEIGRVIKYGILRERERERRAREKRKRVRDMERWT